MQSMNILLIPCNIYYLDHLLEELYSVSIQILHKKLLILLDH